MENTRVLVLGAAGMLGNTVFRLFADSPGFDICGSVRSTAAARLLPPELLSKVVSGIDVDSADNLAWLLDETRPNWIINCIGLVKQRTAANNPLSALPINSLLPHRLSRLAALARARVVHISTDCVFAGTRGNYVESDAPDAQDLYGRSKLLGELDYPHAITLRTSIIGHELTGAHGLLEWFLSQQGEVGGFSRAVFSGLPTVELARVIRDFVVPNPHLHGVYHVSASAINKHELLGLIAKAYNKKVALKADDHLVIDRSLNSERFQEKTGYRPPSWPELVQRMREFG